MLLPWLVYKAVRCSEICTYLIGFTGYHFTRYCSHYYNHGCRNWGTMTPTELIQYILSPHYLATNQLYKTKLYYKMLTCKLSSSHLLIKILTSLDSRILKATIKYFFVHDIIIILCRRGPFVMHIKYVVFGVGK